MTALAPSAATATWAGRRPELEDPLNRHFFHPLALVLARLLLPTGVSPNAVSILSGLLVCLAAVFYTHVAWPVGALAGFACHLAWHVADGADGDLARLSGRTSPLGEFIDGAADYSGHIVMYVLFAAVLDDGPLGAWAWVLAIVSGASRIAQSNHCESQRRQYLWRVYGVGWLKTASTGQGQASSSTRGLAKIAAPAIRAYLALAAATAPNSALLDQRIGEAATDPARLARIRDKVRQSSGTSLILEKALGANWRTVLLGICMLVASPGWYFVWETGALNGLLIVSIAHHNRVERRLLAELA